jgi:hypothetical protein
VTKGLRHATWVLPLLVLGLVCFNHIAWLNLHTALETWDDDAGLFKLSMCLMDKAAGQGTPCSVGAPYPPLVPWISSLLYGFKGGASLALALASLLPFLVLLCVALFVGLQRAVSPMAGLAAMAIGPVMVWSLHIRGKYYTEIPLAALVVAAVVALAASDTLRRRWPSLGLGVCLGLGLMTKWSFAFFLGPVAAVALALATFRAFTSSRQGTISAVVVLAVPALVLAGAADWIPYGITAGFWIGISLGVVLGILTRLRPALFEPGARTTLVNVGLVVLLTVFIAGPWYWHYLPTMREFLAANLAQKFHGDPVSGLAGWPFYPAILFTRMMSTPMVVLSLIGGVLALRSGAPPLIRWTAAALVSGVLILGILPYRSGRYLIAGTGLLAILSLWPLARSARLARWLLPAAFGLGMVHQLSWVPLASGGARLPHHWPIFTLPEADLMGNTQRGITAAYRDLMNPRWRFLPVANPPIQGPALSAWAAARVHQDAGQRPSLSVVFDEAQRLNLNAMSSHLAALRPPPTTQVIAAPGRLSEAGLVALRHRAQRPRDQPATADGLARPRVLYVVLGFAPAEGPSASVLSLLRRQGFKAVARHGVMRPMDAVGLSIWRAPKR